LADFQYSQTVKNHFPAQVHVSGQAAKIMVKISQNFSTPVLAVTTVRTGVTLRTISTNCNSQEVSAMFTQKITDTFSEVQEEDELMEVRKV